MKCRHCGSDLNLLFLDLGSAPPSNAYLTAEKLREPELWFPLRLLVCEYCWLVQTEDYASRETLFTDNYAYFSSYSTSWLAHAQRYVVEIIARFNLGPASCVVEVGANDGYLLQYVKEAGIRCYGIEPTASTAQAASQRGIEIIERFFGIALADELAATGRQADLIVANNVLAHVPDINDFVAGFSRLLKSHGVATFEFPHLLKLVQKNQFDTIYHEHFSYLSLIAVNRIFAVNGLTVFHVEEHLTHGGSLRVLAQRSDTGQHPRSAKVDELLQREALAGMLTADYYAGFQSKTDKVKDDFLTFLLETKRQGKTMAGYGAAAKGNTLLNYTGVRSDLLPFVCDAAPSKQGKYLPGSRIPILPPTALKKRKPDIVLILPWNIADEVVQQHRYIREWGGRFAVAVPSIGLLP